MRLAFALICAIHLTGSPASADEVADLCGNRPDCVVQGVFTGGVSSDGEPIKVVDLVFPIGQADSSFAESCIDERGYHELYSVVGTGQATVTRRLVEFCDPAMLRLVTYSVYPNRLLVDVSHHTLSFTKTFQISPFRLFAYSEFSSLPNSFAENGYEFRSSHWDWTNWSRGHAARFHPRACWTAEGSVQTASTEENTTRVVLIPRVKSSTLPEDWQAARLGSCAAQIGSGGRTDDVGDEIAAEGAWTRLLVVEPDLLFVTARTATLAGFDPWDSPASSASRERYLDIWQDLYQGPVPLCGQSLEAAHWRIRLSDGYVTNDHDPGLNDPTVLSLQRTDTPDGASLTTLLIHLVRPPGLLTIAGPGGYTSKNWSPEVEKLGWTELVNGSCTIVEGELTNVSHGLPMSGPLRAAFE